MREIMSNCWRLSSEIRQLISFLCSGADDVVAVLAVAEDLACLEYDSVVMLGAVAHEAISDLCCSFVVFEEAAPVE
jgi:hypothetical protein